MSVLEESLASLDVRDDGSLKALCASLFPEEEIPQVLHYVQATAHILGGRHDDMVGIGVSDESDLAMALAVSCHAVTVAAGWDAGEYARLFVRAWHRLNVDL